MSFHKLARIRIYFKFVPNLVYALCLVALLVLVFVFPNLRSQKEVDSFLEEWGAPLLSLGGATAAIVATWTIMMYLQTGFRRKYSAKVSPVEYQSDLQKLTDTVQCTAPDFLDR